MAKTYYTVPGVAAGDTFTEAMWDNYISTNINNLVTPPAVCLTGVSAGTCNSGTLTTIAFTTATEDFDNDTMHSTSSNQSRLVAQTAGVYIVVGQINWPAVSGGSLYFLNIYKNGAATQWSRGDAPAYPNGVSQLVVGLMKLAASDYVTIAGYQNSGTNVSPDAYFGMHWLGKG